ncbi:MAG: RluA family pseudouridine synthase [Caldilineaceae bacterium]|nr:RluA family pseudouridine synthase [Caldilineaceae bacterium]
MIHFTVAGLDRPTRLDRLLRTQFPQWGRQAVQRLIAGRKVTVNRRAVWLASWEVHNGDQVAVADAPAPKPAAPARFDERWLIAETPELVAVNKPAGLLAEPTRWGQGANLLDLATARFGRLILFHRLDRDTSGVVLLTRPGPINQWLDQAFKQHMVVKEYLAVVQAPNSLAPAGVIDLRLAPDPRRRDRMVVVARGGQRAVTRYAIEEQRDGRQLVRLWPKTGRTHQLRVHLAHLGAPILGDRLYGPQPATGARLMLHAYRITLPAMTGEDERTFVAPLPANFWPHLASEAR